MAVWVTHPAIVKGRLNYSKSAKRVTKQVDNVQAASAYFNEELGEQILDIRQNEINELEKKCKSASPTALLKGPLGLKTDKQSKALLSAIHINFFHGVGYQDPSFSLGVIFQTDPIVAVNPIVMGHCDWDRNLTERSGPNSAGNWNDDISSVHCGDISKYWMLCEHVGFGGDHVVGFGNFADLRELPGSTPSRHWNDEVSSIIMCSIPQAVLDEALRILTM